MIIISKQIIITIMKKIFILALMSTLLSSCMLTHYMPYDKLRSVINRNSGALVNYSETTGYTYNLKTGNLRLVNGPQYITVSRYDGRDWKVIDRVSKIERNVRSYPTSTNGKAQRLVIDVTPTAAFVRIYEGHLIVGRHKF